MSLSLRAASALLAISAPLMATADTGSGTPGFEFTTPATVMIGTDFTFCVTSPPGNQLFFLVSLGNGPIQVPLGTLCVGPSFLAVPLGTQVNATDCFTVPVDCRTNFIGVEGFMQVASVEPGNPANSGVTNGASIIAVDGPCTDPCLGDLAGCVYQDLNGNGALDPGELPVPGVDVIIFNSAEIAVATLTTDANGKWSVFDLIDTNPLRIEFSGYPDWLGINTVAEGGREVQFTNTENCEYDLGLVAPAELCPEGTDACLATPCYVNGDPLAGGSAGTNDVLVRWPYAASGFGANEYLATGVDIGATWGLAYQQSADRLFAASFLKRHMGFGPGGIDAIYAIDSACFGDEGSTPASVWLNVNTLPGVDVGTLNRPDLPPGDDQQSFDAEAFDGVGKLGLGGIAISDDERTLYAVNLNQREVLEIDIDTKMLTNAYPVDTGLSCVNGVARPFAVTSFRGELYVGVTCTGELDPFNPVLEAHVRRLDSGVFTTVLTVPLAYDRNVADISCPLTGWFPWLNVFSTACNPLAVFQQPMLSSIEFHADGCLALGFTDRHGNQTGFQNYTPTTMDLYEGISGGDLLRACDENGTYVLESNGSAGGVTTAGAGNNEGPGGGEYYFDDTYSIGALTAHYEVMLGGVVVLPGSGEVISTAFDPIDQVPGEARTGGTRRMDVQTGAFIDAYRIYEFGAPGSFGKAAGLGDLALLCSAPPTAVGDRLFRDDNADGLQTASDVGISGIEVQLFRDGLFVDSTLSDDDGLWSFEGLVANIPSGYEIRIDLSQQATTNLTATQRDAGTNDAIDSDGDLLLLPGFIVIPFATEGPGVNDYTLDVGFIVAI